MLFRDNLAAVLATLSGTGGLILKPHNASVLNLTSSPIDICTVHSAPATAIFQFAGLFSEVHPFTVVFGDKNLPAVLA
jgi:hypothetical protein